MCEPHRGELKVRATGNVDEKELLPRKVIVPITANTPLHNMRETGLRVADECMGEYGRVARRRELLGEVSRLHFFGQRSLLALSQSLLNQRVVPLKVA